VAIVNSVIAAFYYLNVLRYMFFQPAPEGATALELSPALTTALVVTCGLTLIIGLYAQPFLQLARFSVRLLGS
jgi:NADH:ubiquinone oxidoreductase subunit 2 (subunit N)